MAVVLGIDGGGTRTRALRGEDGSQRGKCNSPDLKDCGWTYTDTHQEAKKEIPVNSPWLKSGFDAYKDGFKTSNEYGDGQA
jgi:hypothetical protein